MIYTCFYSENSFYNYANYIHSVAVGKLFAVAWRDLPRSVSNFSLLIIFNTVYPSNNRSFEQITKCIYAQGQPHYWTTD